MSLCMSKSCSKTAPIKKLDSICLFANNNNPICMSSRSYEILRDRVMSRFNLHEVPSVNEVRELLGINSHIRIQDRVRDFLSDDEIDDLKIVNEFRIKVPDIQHNGLSGLNVTKAYQILQKYYPFFHYRGPCLLDFDSHSLYNYSDFRKYPLFKSNKQNYDVYNLLMLTVRSTTFGPGHWVSVCVVRNALFYYDSLNEDILPEFQNLINLIIVELKSQYDNVITWRNREQVQFDGKHCGVFQIHFVTVILELYASGRLFNCYGDNIVSLNENELEYYLQNGLTQEIIEDTVSSYFYINN